MTAPILEIRDLSVHFGGLRAVDDVSFTVARNRITTVIGPNGAGKSTLFNLISGALRPRNGHVLIEGVDYTAQPPYRMLAAGLARSFQITNLFFELIGGRKPAAGGAGARTAVDGLAAGARQPQGAGARR